MSGAAASSATRVLPPGTMVGERFRLVRLRGQGGMGAVYEAKDSVIDRTVALKLLCASGAEAAARFEREARAASRISSRHVAAVHDFGRDPDHGLYIVMELVAGDTLEEQIDRGPLPVARAAQIGAEIAEALDAAHRSGVIHRDLKPSNVIVLADGGSKVLDFGIARLLEPEGAAATHLTLPEKILGTPAYMSPEAIGGGEVVCASDLYALGVILFEMVAGELPFYDEVPTLLLTKHLRDPPPRIADLRPDLVVPAAFAELVAALLEKDPAERPGDARTVAAALRALADGEAPHVMAPRRRTKLRLPVMFLGVLGIVFLAGIVFATISVLRDPDGPTRAAIASPAAQPEPPMGIDEPADPPPLVPETVELRVEVRPASAEILLDGAPITSPHALARDDVEHDLVVRARGYRSATHRVRADADRSIEIVLARSRRTPEVELREW